MTIADHKPKPAPRTRFVVIAAPRPRPRSRVQWFVRPRSAGELVRVATVAIALAACGAPASNATPDQEHATDVAISEWELTFGFAPACNLDRAALRWEVLPDVASVRARCGLGEAIDACHLRNYAGESTIVVLADRGDYLPDVWSHELAHWLQSCSGEPSDHQHANPAVWGRQAFEGQLAARLRSELAP